MKFSNFLFPESRNPADDGRTIQETIEEARLSDSLGFDTIWLAEHHFDGICAYVDPVSFAAALARAIKRARIGFAVAQMSLHHPVRFAEQMALLDNLLHGRLIIGLGRGTAYNIYDYRGYDIDPDEAQERLEESEAILHATWTGERVEHKGRFWTLHIPMLRPRPFSAYPPILRAASGEDSMLGFARQGRPFMMNVQSLETTARRIHAYRNALAESGYSEQHIAGCLEDTWVWRNVFVAETDAEAERIAVPAFDAMQQHRKAMRERVFAETGARLAHAAVAAPAHTQREHSLICGSPATVAEKLMPLKHLGVGGVILQFRLGPMPHQDAANSLRLFADAVRPMIGGR